MCGRYAEVYSINVVIVCVCVCVFESLCVCVCVCVCMCVCVCVTDDVTCECWAQLCLMSNSFVRSPDETQSWTSVVFLALLSISCSAVESVSLNVWSSQTKALLFKHFGLCSEFWFDWAETQRCWFLIYIALRLVWNAFNMRRRLQFCGVKTN